MFDLLFKAIGFVREFRTFRRERKEDKQELEVTEGLRQAKLTGTHSGLRAVIGSDEDRLYSKMVDKGRLVRHGADVYMLPVQGQSSRFQSRFGAR